MHTCTTDFLEVVLGWADHRRGRDNVPDLSGGWESWRRMMLFALEWTVAVVCRILEHCIDIMRVDETINASIAFSWPLLLNFQ